MPKIWNVSTVAMDRACNDNSYHAYMRSASELRHLIEANSVLASSYRLASTLKAKNKMAVHIKGKEGWGHMSEYLHT